MLASFAAGFIAGMVVAFVLDWLIAMQRLRRVLKKDQ
jgi:hypothetical protein